MKKRAIIHIGTCKTGTTSIQTCLQANRNVLEEGGYSLTIPWDGPREIHDLALIWPCKLLFEQPLFSGENALRQSYQEYQELDYADLLQAGVDKVSSLKDYSFIISCEALSDVNLARFRKKMSMVKELLTPLRSTHEVTIIVYYRRQDAFLESLYDTWQRPCYRVSFQDFMDPLLPFDSDREDEAYELDWEKHSAILQEYFAEASILEYSYDLVLRKQELVSHFLSAIGIEHLGVMVPAKREKVSVSTAMLQVLHNVKLSAEESKALISFSGACPELKQETESSKVLMPASLRKEMLEYYAPINREFFECTDEEYQAVFAPGDEYPEPLTREEAFQMLARLIAGKEQRALDRADARRKRILRFSPSFVRKMIPQSLRTKIYNRLS